jgi:hypothetical protein
MKKLKFKKGKEKKTLFPTYLKNQRGKKKNQRYAVISFSYFLYRYSGEIKPK